MGGAIAANLSRLGEAETKAARQYRESVHARREADATPVPRLSEKAQAAVERLARTSSDRARAAAWAMTATEPAVLAELEGFAAAMAKRFGQDGMRAMLRAQAGGRPFDDPSVPAKAKTALPAVARAIAVIRAAKQAAAQIARESERHSRRATLRF